MAFGYQFNPFTGNFDLISTVSVGAVGSSPNSSGASISSSQVLTLQPADATRPGLITSGTQTLGGAKTFSTSILSPIFSSSNSNPASAGIIRLANAEAINFRNAGNSTDYGLSLDASNIFQLGNALTVAGHLKPSVNNVDDLGDSSTFWHNLYLSNDADIRGFIKNASLYATGTSSPGCAFAASGARTMVFDITPQGVSSSFMITSAITGSKTLNIPDFTTTPDDMVLRQLAQTLTNKTLAVGSNHITGTTGKIAQFNASTGDLEAASTSTSDYLPLAGGTMSGAINMGSHLINSVLDPVSSQDAATKNYVDTLINGLYWKQSCIYATATALPANTYNNGSSGVGAFLTGVSFGALSIDGNVVTVGQRVLVKNEATGANNGIYVVTTVGAVATLYVLTRAADFNSSADINTGDSVYIVAGTVNADTSWSLSTTGTITVGSTTLTFAQVAGPGSITIGSIDGQSAVANGLTIVGTAIYAQSADATHPGMVNNTTQTLSGVKTFSSAPNLSSLSASQAVVTDGSKNLASLAYASANTASAIVQRDSSGNFSAGTVTAALTGTASGNTTYSANNHGVVLSSASNAMTVVAPASSTVKVLVSGGSSADPSWAVVPATSVPAAQAISSTSIDWSAGNVFTKTLGANTTFTFTGNVSGQTIVVRLTNTVSNYTVTWPTVRWSGGSAPTMSTGAVSDIYTFVYDGSNFYGSAVQNMT